MTTLSSSFSAGRPPFQLRKIDHIVLRCKDYKAMFQFYTEVLGCTIDKPEDVGRFGGVLSHLRAGDAFIDLLSYDDKELSNEGKEAILRLHSGGEGVTDGMSKEDVSMFHPSVSTLDHFCLKADPFNEEDILSFMESNGISVLSSRKRYGAEGIAHSIYIKDPEGNIVEISGNPNDEKS